MKYLCSIFYYLNEKYLKVAFAIALQSKAGIIFEYGNAKGELAVNLSLKVKYIQSSLIKSTYIISQMDDYFQAEFYQRNL